MNTFQDIILNLQNFWCAKNCILQQSHDLQTGAGTFNPETFLRALGPEPYNVCHVEISRRPTDGRYGENPNRLQRFHQFQVMMKPAPNNMQQLYLESLEAIGFDLSKHDIRFVHDDWESPTQGASGLGWEVWCDGMEITQFTYFQQIGGVALTEIPVELAYGIERIALFLQKEENVYDLAYNQTLSYGDVFLDAEKQYCRYNFDEATVSMWERKFDGCEAESKLMVEKGLAIPAYDMAVEASNCFNMLDARGAISVTARISMIHRVRDLCCNAAKCYLEHREREGFSLLVEKDVMADLPLAPVKEISSGEEDFLLEIGTEHLPANAIPAASISLTSKMKAFFKDHNIATGEIEMFATPRRLAVLVHGMSVSTKELMEEKKGPALAIAFDDNGMLTKQGSGFFRSIGTEISTRAQMDKEPRIKIIDGRLVFTSKKEKIFTGKLLQECLPSIVSGVAFPKKMKWDDKGSVFSRPVRSVVAMIGKNIIDVEICGVRSSNKVSLNAQQNGGVATLSSASEYLAKLRKGKVLACVNARKEFIESQLKKICDEDNTSTVRREAVMSQVLFLSEYPILAKGGFDDRFLALPEELIVSEMIDHQKYFPMKSSDNTLLTTFIVAVDKEPTELIISNYERVLTARLSDGLFLFRKDLKASFEQWNHMLEKVTHHPKLGSIYNKVERICSLSDTIAARLDIKFEKHAALFCKADLVSNVVFEFPELQGIMGRYYAQNFGESEEVAHALEEIYMPKSEGSEIPHSMSGKVVALADRFDNLLSYMGIGLIPTSSKDPYALRRSAVGINRILIESKLSLDLREIIDDEKIAQFVILRMKPMLKEYGFTSANIEMCGVYNSFDPYKIYKCVEAIAHVNGSSDEFVKLIEMHKRIKGSVGEKVEQSFSEKILEDPYEKTLSASIKNLEQTFNEHIKNGNFEEAFGALSGLVKPLEDFFKNVHVNTDDTALKNNRIALLNIPYQLMTKALHF
jgi:glycyl-tRNA synthetase